MINVAIIGNGGICPAHVESYLKFPDRCRIAALVDIVPGKAEKMKERFGLDCETLEDYHELFSRGIDLADICTPPFTHAFITIDCLKAGLNVVCEKPMAASLEECDAMIRARDESGKKLTIIAQNRFRKEIRDVRALVQSGMAGKVRDVRIDSFWFRAHCYYDLWWRGTWEK